MPAQKHPFPLLLLLVLLPLAHALAPNSNCLAHCNACDPNELALCRGPNPCHWGHYDPHNNGSCTPLPTLSLLVSELGERTDRTVRKVQGSWGNEAKVSTCQYAGKSGKHTVDILGLFGGVAMLQRTFSVEGGSDLLELSFNLVREEWLPFNDFLMVDVSSAGNVIESLEISFETRIKVETQPTSLICSGKKVLSEKYSIKFANGQRVGSQLTVVFTSFLYSANWGLTNVQLLQGCSSFSLFDQRTLSCTICDPDSYLLDLPNGSLWCQKCPLYCLTCTSSQNCLTCLNGTVLDNGTCQLPFRFKTQLIPLGETTKQCGKKLVMVGGWGSAVLLGPIKNEYDELYDQIQISFDVYYNPKDWTDSMDKVKVKLNQGEIFTLNANNFTNKATDTCLALRGNKTAVITIFSNTIIHNDNVANLELQFVGKSKAIEFAVSDFRIKSLKKAIFKQASPSVSSAPLASIPITNPVIPTTPSITTPAVSSAVLPPIPISTPQAAPTIEKVAVNEAIKISPSLTVSKAVEPQISPSVQTTVTSQLNEPKTVEAIQPQLEPTTNQPKPETVVPSTQQSQPMDTLKKSAPQFTDSPSLPITNDLQPPTIILTTYPAPTSIALSDPSPSPATSADPYHATLGESQLTPTSNSAVSQEAKVSTLKTIETNSTDINQIAIKPLADSISYRTVSDSTASALQIYLKNVQKTFSSISVTLDKLPQDKYEVSSFSYVGRDLHITLSIASSFTNGLLSVLGSNPGRILQTSQTEPIAAISITRFDAYTPNELASTTTFSHIFAGFAWVGIVLIFGCILLGQGVIAEEYVLTLQTLFLHVYLAVDCPLSFSEVMSGLGILQNLDFLGRSVVRFSLWRDISFTSQFYPIIFVNCFYLVWFGCILLAKKYILRNNLIDEEKSVPHRLVDLATCRLINFSDQIWRYQFFPTLWLCLLQLHSSSGIFDTILCIASLVCTIAWPSFVFLHSRQQYYENEYSEYLYKFEDMYYRRIPQYQLPTNHHRMGYPLLRIAKTAVLVVLAVFLPSSWFSLLLMTVLQVGEIAYARLNDIYIDQQYFRFKFFENSLLIAIEITLLCLACLHSYLSSSTYVAMGFLLSGLAFLCIFNAFLRVGYLGHKKYLQIFGIEFQEVPDLDKKKLQTEQ